MATLSFQFHRWKNLGPSLILLFLPHIKSVSKSYWFNFQNLSEIQLHITAPSATTLVSQYPPLDYCRGPTWKPPPTFPAPSSQPILIAAARGILTGNLNVHVPGTPGESMDTLASALKCRKC